MTIICDAFGGDNAPLEIIKGCELAIKEYGYDIILTGDEEIIRKTAQENGISLDKIAIEHSTDVISMCDEPASILKEHKECSMAVGLRLLSEGKGDAFVSAGSTGALLIGSTFIVKRIKGIRRCALAPVMPNSNGIHLLIDSGANVECKPEMLLQFGIMGSVYMEKIMGIENPRVGLLNVGTEDTKGGPLQREAFDMIKNADLNFIGNVEARDCPFGVCDVIVADGFTGNVFLKLYEGMAMAMMDNIKGILTKNLMTKLTVPALKPGLREFKNKMSTDKHGGAPVMGVSRPVFKAHGNSKAKAFMSAIYLAGEYSRADAIGAIEAATQG